MSEKPQTIETAPSHWYSDPHLWPIEQKGAFAGNWQFLTHESAIDQPLMWRAETLAGYRIIVVRDKEGDIRAFHNVCRHRAGPLVKDTSGVCDGALTCQYHGWKYTLYGRLRSARDFGVAADFDPRDFSLFPIHIELWRGLIFAYIGDNPPPLMSVLAPLDARLGALDWSGLRVALRRTHTLDCNWKTYVENYLEGYHIPTMHPSLDAEIKSDDYRVDVEGRVVFHNVEPRNSEAISSGLWAWVWPNIAVNVYQNGLMIERMSPIGHAQTQLDYLYLTPNGDAIPDETIAMSDQVTLEDKWITQRVQENLNAGVYVTGRLSPKHEGGIAAFQSWVREIVGGV